MYSMIIADDEPVILNGLSKLLDWDSLGIQITGKCTCYSEVIDCLTKNHCDIIITDINMPEKNGLEILKYINEHSLRMKTIFISGFSEFSYVHEALRNGAVDYLTKPVNKDILLEAVKKSIRGLPANDNILEKKLIDYGIINSVNINNSENNGNDYKFYTALNVYFNSLGMSRQQLDLLMFSFTAEIEESLPINNIVFERGKAVCILLNHDTTERIGILNIAEDILNIIKEKMHMNAVIIIGKSVEGTENIPLSYKSAETLEPLVFYCDNSSVINSDNAPEIQKHSSDSEITNIEQSMIDYVYKLNSEKLADAVCKAVEQIKRISLFMPNTTKAYVISTLNRLSIEIHALNSDENFNSNIEDIFARYSEKINNAQRFEDVKSLTAKCVLDVKTCLNNLDSSAVDAIIKSKEFIKNHYNENITLESVAKNVFMNPFYFSTFFKKHTNKNFKEYLNEIRLQNAVRLLMSTNLRPSEIAEKTGFKSSRSMNKLFQETYGKMPNEYRKDTENKNP